MFNWFSTDFGSKVHRFVFKEGELIEWSVEDGNIPVLSFWSIFFHIHCFFLIFEDKVPLQSKFIFQFKNETQKFIRRCKIFHSTLKNSSVLIFAKFYANSFSFIDLDIKKPL